MKVAPGFEIQLKGGLAKTRNGQHTLQSASQSVSIEVPQKHTWGRDLAMNTLMIVYVLLFCSCSAHQANDPLKPVSRAEDRTTPAQEVRRLNDPISSGFFNGTPEEEKQAWLSFIKDGRYQIAQPEDFQFPPRAKDLQSNDIEKARKQPFVGGDINGDGVSNDFAAIVVDKRISNSLKFSLVIFSQPSRISEPYTQHFLYSRRDLSKTLLEWWSGGLAVREYLDDGSYRYCYVKWNKTLRKYSCEKER